MNPVTVRNGQEQDLPELSRIYNYYVRTSHATFDLEEPTPGARFKWFQRYSVEGPHQLLVATAPSSDDGHPIVVGYVTSSHHRPKPAYSTTIETTVYVHEQHTGRSLGSRLYDALFERLHGLDLHRAYAGIALPNPASIALHRKLGFESIGLYHEVGRKFNRYWSVEWFEKRLDS